MILQTEREGEEERMNDRGRQGLSSPCRQYGVMQLVSAFKRMEMLLYWGFSIVLGAEYKALHMLSLS